MQESVTQDREKFLGGSDIPAVMGISPFVKRFDLLKFKAGIESIDFQGNEYTEYGNEMEGKIRDYINAGCSAGQYVEDKVVKVADVINWRYHSDGFNEKLHTVLEIKTTSQIHGNARDYKMYLAQLLFGMHIHNVANGMLAVYSRPDDMSIEFDEDRLQIFDIYIGDYMTELTKILASINLFNQDLAYLKTHKDAEEYMLPSRASLLDMSDVEYEIAGKQINAMYLLFHEKEITSAIKMVKEKMRDAMEKYGINSARFEDGMLISYIPAKEGSTKEEFDVKAFAKDHPEIYQQYLVEKEVKGKASYVAVRHSKN